jgi:hypothetical protein
MSGKKSNYPDTGVLIWKENKTGKEHQISSGPWALLNSLRSRLKQDPCYLNGKFRLSYSSQ